MIKNKKELKKIISYEKQLYRRIGYKNTLNSIISNSEIGYIFRYIKLLRMDEYYSNTNKKIRRNIIRRRRNKLGLLLGMNIPINTFQEGLLIYHSNGNVVNKNARVGKNCKIHGNICIGNNGISEDTPIIGDNVDIGIGAKIIGKVQIANNIRIGANSVVTKSFTKENTVIAGIPAKVI